MLHWQLFHDVVKVLGTLITEWEPGRELLESLLEDKVLEIHRISDAPNVPSYVSIVLEVLLR